MLVGAPPAAKNEVAINQANPPIAAMTKLVLTPAKCFSLNALTTAPIIPPKTATRAIAWMIPPAVPNAWLDRQPTLRDLLNYRGKEALNANS